MTLKLLKQLNVHGNPKPKLAFFGGEPLAVPVLNELESAGIVPQLIVCNPDRQVGRKQVLTPPSAKVWAQERGLEVFQPTSYKDREALAPLTEPSWDLFLVVAYNFILPKWLIELPMHKTINLHPSLLPKLRGPSPIRSAILNDEPEHIGVSVMLMDEEMDHGPLLTQERYVIPKNEWPADGQVLDAELATLGGKLLAQTIPNWLSGEIIATAQDHEHATYTKKFTRTDGELVFDPRHLPSGDAAYQIYLKICALSGWPETFFIHNGERIKIKKAELGNSTLRLLRVVPEGRPEMDFETYLTRLGEA